MENWNYRPTLSRVILLLLFFSISILGFNQDLQKIKEVAITDPVGVSLDRSGSIFVAHKRGSISKFSKTGEVELVYSPERNAAITLIEAWTTLDILTFQEGIQSLTLLNRFLTPISVINLSTHIGYARLATFNYESNIWVIDDTDFSLKLLDTSLDKVTINTPLNLILNEDDYQLTFIREYQNLLFIGDLNTGVLVFDNLGNYLKTLAAEKIKFFGFIENEIYYHLGDELILTDIYTITERRINVPRAKYYLVTKDQLYAFRNDRLEIYEY